MKTVHFGEDYAIIELAGKEFTVSMGVGVALEEEKVLPGILKICPVHKKKVVPDETGRCSLCQIHKT